MNQVARTRTDDSVQFSLAELRTIETVRLEHEAAERARQVRVAEEMRQEAERRRVEAERAAEERRVAAEREHERALAAERMRLDAAERQAQLEAEARLQQQRLAIEAKKVEVELAGRQAVTERPRGRMLTWLLAGALVAAAVALLWTQRAGAREHAALQSSMQEMTVRATAAEARVGELDRALAELKLLAARPAVSDPTAPAPEKPETATPTGKKPPKKVPIVKPPITTIPKVILTEECMHSPNGCDE